MFDSDKTCNSLLVHKLRYQRSGTGKKNATLIRTCEENTNELFRKTTSCQKLKQRNGIFEEQWIQILKGRWRKFVHQPIREIQFVCWKVFEISIEYRRKLNHTGAVFELE